MTAGCGLSFRNVAPSEEIRRCLEEGAARLHEHGSPIGACRGHVERAGGAVVVLLELAVLGRPLTLLRRLPSVAGDAEVCAALRSAFRVLGALAPAPPCAARHG